jgi:hypothetical protein
MKNKKTMRKVGAIALVIGLLATVGIGAYLTDTDVKTDTYTIGSVEIVNNFEAKNTEHMIANQVVSYDNATISNTGISDAFVFMTVDVPVVTTGTHEADGTPVAADVLELFAQSGKSAEWVQVGDALEVTEGGNLVAMRYVYAYGSADALTALASGETTSDVFTDLTAINFDNDLASTAGYEVELNAYGIQTQGLGEADTAEEVWNVIRAAFSISEAR